MYEICGQEGYGMVFCFEVITEGKLVFKCLEIEKNNHLDLTSQKHMKFWIDNVEM